VVVDTAAIDVNEPDMAVTAAETTATETTATETTAAAAKTAKPLTLQQINRYCIIWMAGIAAEMHTYGSAQGGEDDKMQIKRLWQQSRSVGEVDTQLRWALLQAQTLLEKQQAAYQALVTAMRNRDSVAVCCQQIEANRVPTAGE
jgi:hypothetical protein